MGQVLRDELVNDPLARGYSTMSDTQVAVDLNTGYRTGNVDSFSGDEAFSATDTTEFAALTDHQQDLWLSFCGRDSIDPWEQANVDLVIWIFGASSATVTALGELRTETISRAEELGIGQIDWRSIRFERNHI